MSMEDPYVVAVIGLLGVILGSIISAITFKCYFLRFVSVARKWSTAQRAIGILEDLNRSLRQGTQEEAIIMADFELCREICEQTFDDKKLNEKLSELFKKGLAVDMSGDDVFESRCHTLIAETIVRLHELII